MRKHSIVIIVLLLSITHVYGACLQAQTIVKESSELYYQKIENMKNKSVKNEGIKNEAALPDFSEQDGESVSIEEQRSSHVTKEKGKETLDKYTPVQIILLIIGLMVTVAVVIGNR